MRIRHLRIRINTDKGLFGVDIPFPDGLFVLRAENSMGKSTCLKSIVVALGMEAILTASRDDLPLPPVLKDEVHTENGHAKVIESEIFVEIGNHANDRIVVQRMIKGQRDSGLVEVTHGPALSSPGKYPSEQFFVGRPGDTTRDLGFLRFLINFLGWKVPTVRTFQGDERPLYPQCIVPYFFIEQSRGWSTLEPPLPTRFGIKEMSKRAVEYLLDLDAIKIAEKRLEIEEAEQSVEREWNAVVGGIKAIAKGIGGMVQKVPASPVATWPPQLPPALMMPKGDAWISLDEKQIAMQERLDEIVNQEIPRVAEIVGTAKSELSEVQERLMDRQAILARLLEAYNIEKGEVSGTEERLSKIEEDLQRNKDSRTLLQLGGTATPNVAGQQCPTCHQQIVDSLTPLANGQAVMSIEDNINFLTEQHRTFQAVLANQRRVVEARERQVFALREEVSDLRGRIRSLKETLVADGRTPSIEAVRERVHLQEGLDRLNHSMVEFTSELQSLEDLAGRWKALQVSKGELPPGDTSDEDKKKISRWGELLREQLRQFDFRSLDIEEISVSSESYRPLHDGFDLPTNISASDFIRVIWSYLNGLRELGLEFKTNHPGLLVFDEPRQQSAKDLSFEQLLKRAASAGASGHQVIFATSEKEGTVKQMLSDVPHTYHAFPGHVIERIGT